MVPLPSTFSLSSTISISTIVETASQLSVIASPTSGLILAKIYVDNDVFYFMDSINLTLSQSTANSQIDKFNSQIRPVCDDILDVLACLAVNAMLLCQSEIVASMAANYLVKVKWPFSLFFPL